MLPVVPAAGIAGMSLARWSDSHLMVIVTPEQLKALAIMSYYISGGEREHPTTLDTAAQFAQTMANGHESEERIALVHETAADLWELAVAANVEV